MNSFEVYLNYLAMKNHFTKPNYDYFKYNKKTRASISSFNKRSDKYWFERLSRQKSDDEVKDFFLSNFVALDNPQAVWIGQLIREGESSYKEWIKRQQSLMYIFKQESESLLSEGNLEEVLDASRQHPIILKKFLSGNICIETLTIWDQIFLFRNKFDKQLLDPVWEIVSLKIQKYSPFLNTDVKNYKKVLKTIVER